LLVGATHDRTLDFERSPQPRFRRRADRAVQFDVKIRVNFGVKTAILGATVGVIYGYEGTCLGVSRMSAAQVGVSMIASRPAQRLFRSWLGAGLADHT
jgi:hypothetical protein